MANERARSRPYHAACKPEMEFTTTNHIMKYVDSCTGQIKVRAASEGAILKFTICPELIAATHHRQRHSTFS